ncbi:MAG: molybdenum cofactor guanylyltransferase MobA [Betaproteobacteria bacterium]|jgi:molybdopterin-guanine dinucleotide biosynthesis protein A|nr:molybdenum cofactor guanylyltransferase [Rubrivivax sp.]
MSPGPRRGAITGLVLCGGRATRMGGVEKALVPWAGRPLLAHVIDRLAPQVGEVALNVNRQAALYAGFGLPLWPDADDTLPGPLAGWLAALARAPTEWLLSVPCDSPLLPADLAARLALPLAGLGAPPLAIAATADGPQPVFALLHRSLAPALAAALARGERGALRFARAQGAAEVAFDDPGAFADADTPEDLARLAPR